MQPRPKCREGHQHARLEAAILKALVVQGGQGGGCGVAVAFDVVGDALGGQPQGLLHLHFANNGDELGPEAVQAIEAVAQQLKAYPGEYSVVVEGHTSSLGGKAHNKAPSLRRAQAVAQVLIQAGIPAAKVTSLGVGPEQPVADNRTREGQRRNRRVEIEGKTPKDIEKTRTDTGLVDAPAPV